MSTTSPTSSLAVVESIVSAFFDTAHVHAAGNADVLHGSFNLLMKAALDAGLSASQLTKRLRATKNRPAVETTFATPDTPPVVPRVEKPIPAAIRLAAEAKGFSPSTLAAMMAFASEGTRARASKSQMLEAAVEIAVVVADTTGGDIDKLCALVLQNQGLLRPAH